MTAAGTGPVNASALSHKSSAAAGREDPERAEGQTVTFRRMRAQDYRVTEEDSFYFFNPFSEVILQAVLQEIIGSWYENPRQIYLFFYYPKDEDVALLSMYDEILFYDEIDCTDLYGGRDSRERVLIYEIPSDSDNI